MAIPFDPMLILTSQDLRPPLPPQVGGLALTIGNFDGVHRGHLSLTQRTRAAAAARDVSAAVLTFEPHPAQVLGRGPGPSRLTPASERRVLLAAAGIDLLIEQRFTAAWAALEPERFAHEVLFDALRVRHLVVGYDFAFGAGRRGDAASLLRWGTEMGVAVEVAPALEEPGVGVVSSSRIRRAIGDGELGLAHQLLGRPHHLIGTVVKGAQRGRLLGFPTANLAYEPALLPPPGVYAGWLDWGLGQRLAAISVGDNPTFGDAAPTVEAHVLGSADAASEPLDLYGRRCRLSFADRLRSQVRFAGPNALDALTAAIRADVARTRELLADRPPPPSLFTVPAPIAVADPR